ncbi:MAG: nitroreductase family protein [Selenomonadaceae bacterium]|nr:nitroreductase family protein [Selenomonadaceae bacterium]
MDILTLMKERRSIRKYQEKQVPRELVDKIVEAGLYAPNAGGGQRSMIVTLHNAELAKKLGKLNFSTFDRKKLLGGHVSDEQPSVIDDPNIKNGFYDAPTVCVIFGQKDFLFNVADAFCIAENMILAAHALGVDSCIGSRAEETFALRSGKSFMQEWGVPDTMEAKAFVTLGYHVGDYPKGKPRKKCRNIVIE